MNARTLITCRNAARRLLTIALCAGATSLGAQTYSFSLLPARVSGVGLGDTGLGINNAGHVVGTASGTHERWGQLWTSPSTATTLGSSLCCTYTVTHAHDVNNDGWIVGQDTGQAALWINTQPVLLAHLPGGMGPSSALGINDAGQAVGYTIIDFDKTRATLWNGGQATDLGTLGGGLSYAYDINVNGMVVGSSQLAANGSQHATLWHNGTITDLDAAGSQSEAMAINDAGKVVGESAGRATLWDGGAVTYLSSLNSHADDINNRGQVVGSTLHAPAPGQDSDYWAATLWDHGSAIDLNSFLSQSEREAGWVLETATAINNSGWITGSAISRDHGRSAYLLAVTAVPEAATLSLWLAGLGVLGFASRRMRARSSNHPSRMAIA